MNFFVVLWEEREFYVIYRIFEYDNKFKQIRIRIVI